LDNQRNFATLSHPSLLSDQRRDRTVSLDPHFGDKMIEGGVMPEHQEALREQLDLWAKQSPEEQKKSRRKPETQASVAPVPEPGMGIQAGAGDRVAAPFTEEKPAEEMSEDGPNEMGAEKPAEAKKDDPASYVVATLRAAFQSKGLGAQFEQALENATYAGGGVLTCIALLQALRSLNWKSMFWSPDPQSGGTGDVDDSTVYEEVVEEGTYYNLVVDPRMAMADTGATEEPRSVVRAKNIEKLRLLSFGVITFRGGTQIALIINGKIFMVNWMTGVMEERPIEEWGRRTGAIVAPAAEIERFWKG
jgi:hypothetical protein